MTSVGIFRLGSNQLNVIYHFRNWGWCCVSLSPHSPVINSWPFQGGCFVVVLCCLFLVSECRWCFTLRLFILVLFGLGCWVTTFWEIAAHSVDHNVLFVFWLFVILVIFGFGFEDWIWVLIASVPYHCILFTMRLIVFDSMFDKFPLWLFSKMTLKCYTFTKQGITLYKNDL